MRPFLRSLVVLALAAGSAVTLSASKPVFWQTATLNDFLRGDVENLSIDGHGRLVLGPASELVAETTSPFLWAMVIAPDGSIYLGSGNEGKVFKVDGSGKVATYFDTTELEVHALAIASDGSLYAATSPDGRIYKIDRSGKGTPFFDPEDKYIWSLALDSHGNLYAGTGEKGLIYKITPDGKGTTFYATKATHVIALMFEPNGQLLAGTEGPGRLFRVDSAGKAFLLLDSTHQEVRAIRLDPQGNIYLAALSGRTSSSSQPPASPAPDTTSAPPTREPVPTVTTEVTAIAVVDSSGASVGSNEPPAREDRRSGRGAIYRIRPDGLWDILWESGDDSPYDLAFDSTGALIVGTGRNGKLYSLNGNPALRAMRRATSFTRRRTRERSSGFRHSAPPKVHIHQSFATRRPSPIGARSLGVRQCRRAAVSTCSRDRAIPQRPTTRGAPGAAHIRRRTAKRSRARTRVTCNGSPCYRANRPAQY